MDRTNVKTLNSDFSLSNENKSKLVKKKIKVSEVKLMEKKAKNSQEKITKNKKRRRYTVASNKETQEKKNPSADLLKRKKRKDI